MITVDTSKNHPVVEGAGLAGEIVNKRYAEIWVHSSVPNFPPVDQMLLDVLIEDYNERHAPAQKEEQK